MSDERERTEGTSPWPGDRAQVVAGLVVALSGLYLMVDSNNPVWLSAAQFVAGTVMAVPAWRRRRRVDQGEGADRRA
ncbi:hypothetical protein BJF85_14315 [Saccharomonospora sp. CUA-673]|uniref:hypothetical protein n=1 Tax=Saccharomonospora sp. CUA-673 TaxID=1904969 RepID=UPI0009668B79|nr:hypothetical protein [Saccharomonospora sp. CUA-673]OLT47812.1 hypothetical protein BJF85_14315 [Saccharomonospora sp. CUA-673]